VEIKSEAVHVSHLAHNPCFWIRKVKEGTATLKLRNKSLPIQSQKRLQIIIQFKPKNFTAKFA
jgi:hypothetical protein